jgi:hypothetical protein
MSRDDLSTSGSFQDVELDVWQLRRLGKVDEDDAFEHAYVAAVERVVFGLEISCHERRCRESAIQAVRPAVVRTGKLRLVAVAGGVQLRTAVSADVVQRSNLVIVVANDNGRFAEQLDDEVVARFRNLGDVADEMPLVGQHTFNVQCPNRRAQIELALQ